MRCENYFCIYELYGNCKLDYIELDISGLCKSCIYTNIDAKTLNNSKLKTIQLIEK